MSARATRIQRSPPPWSLAVAVAISVLVSVPVSFAAAGVEPARVRVAAPLIDQLVRGLLPMDLVLPGPVGGGSADGGVAQTSMAAVLTELRYCGATDRGAGRFRAVVRWGSLAGGASDLLLGDDGCRQSLADLAKQVPTGAAPDDGVGVSVADVEALWRPWELRLIVARSAAPTPPRPGQPRPLGGLESRRELLAITTAGFRIATDAGETLTFHVAPSFASDAVEILAVLGDRGSGPPSGRPAAGGPMSGSGGSGANVIAELPYGLANQVLRVLTGTQPLAIPIDRDVVDLQSAAIAGAGGGVTVTGWATPRSIRETARLTVQAGGAELGVIGIRADAQLENCTALGMLAAIGCNTRNAGRNAAAAAFGAALANRYQGQLVRDLAGPQELRFDAGGRRFELRGDLLHLGGGARGLSIGARLAPGAGNH